jgi:hypothetical protein
VKNRIIVFIVLLIGAFSAGFLPEYTRATRAERELREAQRENAIAELRDLAALAYIQAGQKNYGLTADTSVRFFGRVREVMNQMPANERKRFEDLLTWRDKVTEELAKSDPGLVIDLQNLFLRTRQLTTTAR